MCHPSTGMGCTLVNPRRPALRHLFDLPILYVTSSNNQTKSLSRTCQLSSVEASLSLACSYLYIMTTQKTLALIHDVTKGSC
ncbi:hypothetical protein U0070_002298 [Myodes glareolus]|uniref:Uncharacterized protein n=1 Tax=Myodes glareolus TaxID=447135 RepID=A0AAW0IAB9_MYOGA